MFDFTLSLHEALTLCRDGARVQADYFGSGVYLIWFGEFEIYHVISPRAQTVRYLFQPKDEFAKWRVLQ